MGLISEVFPRKGNFYGNYKSERKEDAYAFDEVDGAGFDFGGKPSGVSDDFFSFSTLRGYGSFRVGCSWDEAGRFRLFSVVDRLRREMVCGGEDFWVAVY